MSASGPDVPTVLTAYLRSPSALDAARTITAISCLVWIPLWLALGYNVPWPQPTPYTRSPWGQLVLAAGPCIHYPLTLFVLLQAALLARIWW